VPLSDYPFSDLYRGKWADFVPGNRVIVLEVQDASGISFTLNSGRTPKWLSFSKLSMARERNTRASLAVVMTSILPFPHF